MQLMHGATETSTVAYWMDLASYSHGLLHVVCIVRWTAIKLA